jgi:uncharacterized coiled-coil DUF342 family protein
MFPASSSWPQEKNERMSELSRKAHNLGGEVDVARRRPSMHGRNPAELEAEYKQVTEELTQLREEFQGKQSRPKTMSSIMRWSGVAFIIAGGLIVFAQKDG